MCTLSGIFWAREGYPIFFVTFVTFVTHRMKMKC